MSDFPDFLKDNNDISVDFFFNKFFIFPDFLLGKEVSIMFFFSSYKIFLDFMKMRTSLVIGF